MRKLVLFANTDWYLWNFRRSLAVAAKRAGYEVVLISPRGDYGVNFADLGMRWLPLEMDRRSLNPLRELCVLWRLIRLLRCERPALVHGFTIKCAVYGAIAARIAGIPARINAIAGMGYVFSSDDIKARSLRPLVRVLLKMALGGRHARLILQNTDDVALFEHVGLANSTQIRLIRGSGVDCSRFIPHAGSMGGCPRVLLAARLLRDKGLYEYAEAVRIVRAQHPGVRFLLAGASDPGNPAAVSESKVHEWVREGLIEWLGHVDDMAALFTAVDIVVLPSYREGLPKSLIEAAACALALVASNVPGCREVINDGVDGLLVPPRDSAALANAISRLIESHELRMRLGKAARRKALAEFEEKIVIDKTLAVYAEILG